MNAKQRRKLRRAGIDLKLWAGIPRGFPYKSSLNYARKKQAMMKVLSGD